MEGLAGYDEFSGLEDAFDPLARGRGVARMRPARHFLHVEPVVVEPTRLDPSRSLEREMGPGLDDLVWREDPAPSGLFDDDREFLI